MGIEEDRQKLILMLENWCNNECLIDSKVIEEFKGKGFVFNKETLKFLSDHMCLLRMHIVFLGNNRVSREETEKQIEMLTAENKILRLFYDYIISKGDARCRLQELKAVEDSN